MSGSASANFDTFLGDKGQAQSNQQATNDKGQKIYLDSHGNETTEAGTQENPHTAKLATGMASLQVGSNIGYGSDSERSSSITKAGINTQNIEIRNKEAQQQLTGKRVEETLQAIRINTNTDNAENLSGKLDNHFDKNNVQKELNYQVKVMEDFQKVTLASIDTQMASHAENKREAANQAREEGKLAQAQALEQEAKDWEMGGKYKQAVDSVTNAVGLFLGGKGIEGAAVGAASPYINNKIKEATQGNEAANLVAHALWGAVEAYSQGGKAGTGAIAAVTGEAGAKVIAENLYGKSAENLTETEKRTVSELSQVAAGLASGLSSSGGDSYTALTTAQTGKAVAENAVENNYLADWQKEKRDQEIKECHGNISCEAKAKLYWGLVDTGQDVGFASGIIAGIPESLYETVDGIISMASSPSEALEALKMIVMQDNAFSAITESVKQDYIARIEHLQQEYERAGINGAFNAGREVGKLATEVASIATGGAGIAKGGVKVATTGISKGKAILGNLKLANSIDNKVVGIQWGKGIQNQGKPWESYLSGYLPEGTINLNEIKSNFKAFDHLLPDGTAISAKTMDTVGSKTYQEPSKITYQLNKYVDDMVNFNQDRKKSPFFELKNSDISAKEMYLAIPKGTSQVQHQAIQCSVKYAESQGVKIIVKEVQ